MFDLLLVDGGGSSSPTWVSTQARKLMRLLLHASIKGPLAMIVMSVQYELQVNTMHMSMNACPAICGPMQDP
jgi:hypothetical protein